MNKKKTSIIEMLSNHKKYRQKKTYSNIVNNIGISEDCNLLPSSYYFKYSYDEIRVLEKKEIENLRNAINSL